MKKYRTYTFTNQDPIVEKTLELINNVTFADVSRQSGISPQTLSRWKSKKTKRPQFCTIEAVGRAVGKTLVWQDAKRRRK